MSELTPAQQQAVERAFERFLEVYRVESRVPPYADTVEREQQHFEAMREGVAAVLFPALSNGRALDRDNGRPLSERERFEGVGVDYDAALGDPQLAGTGALGDPVDNQLIVDGLDAKIRNGRVPQALRRDLGIGGGR